MSLDLIFGGGTIFFFVSPLPNTEENKKTKFFMVVPFSRQYLPFTRV